MSFRPTGSNYRLLRSLERRGYRAHCPDAPAARAALLPPRLLVRRDDDSGDSPRESRDESRMLLTNGP